MPPQFWHHAHRNAEYARNLLPTRRSQTETATDKRALTPYEKWYNFEAPSYAELHRTQYTFGCECIGHSPKDSRPSVKNSDHGVLCVYLCNAHPDKGHICLVLETGALKTFGTVDCHPSIMPFLIELRKKVPHALQFAPSNLLELNEEELVQDPPDEDH